MNIVIVGVPGVGKGQLASDLHAALKKNHDIVLPVVESDDYMGHFGKAVGHLADYRIELNMAARRAVAMNDYKGAIYEVSLIDSVAYAICRYRDLLERASDEEDAYRWWLVSQTTAAMLRDTFKADHILYVPGFPEDGFYKDLQEAFEAIFEEFELTPIALEPEDMLYEELSAKLSEDFVSAKLSEDFVKELNEREENSGDSS